MANQNTKTCYILGSGQSLLNLTKEEIEFVNNCECVLGFNKYIIFDHMVGIRPTHYLLGDTSIKAKLMFFETLKKVYRKGESHLRYFLAEDYKPGFKASLHRQKEIAKIAGNKSKIKIILNSIYDWRLTTLSHKNATYIDRSNWLQGGEWARSFSDKIFHYRGSLSGAINIVNILYPNYEIRLLGVDLDKHDYFFQKEISYNPEKWGVFLQRLTPESSQHETIVEYNNTGGIQDMFPYIVKNVEKTGGKLFCSNPESYLVKAGLVPYASVIPASET